MKFTLTTLDDAQVLFDWRNDSQTRSMSLNSAPVLWEQHLDWLNNALSSPTRQLYIATNNQSLVGSIRVDIKPQDPAELSWTINPSLRGQGLGKQLLSDFIQQFPAAYYALVKTNNIASQKMCKNAGFILDHQQGGIICYQYVID